jgi:2-C-methyl-D-erythritol 4-phosphate cytidylyltransferase / 2-C-methyl-D-erythritol 2,4-cyclodiphosphate synthase
VKTAALIVAAGRGIRAGGDIPKQYALVGGAPVLAHCLKTFTSSCSIQLVVVVINPDDDALYRDGLNRTVLGSNQAALQEPVAGGATRQGSVLAGLEALAADVPDAVLIHDAARPFVSQGCISAVIEALGTHKGAIAALPLTDTLKRASDVGVISETIDRGGLWRAQTPQGFHFQAILDAHRRAAAAGKNDFTDDAALAEWAGMKVAVIEDSASNIKLTTAEDVAAADRRLTETMHGFWETRTATGYDVHRFTDGDHVWLGGVKIPHTHRLEGHSDADVVLHALTDALLGTIGDGDIGQHFPPSDPQWKGAASHLFLEDAFRRVTARGGRIVNVDVTVLAEAPKIGPHRAAIQTMIGRSLGLSADRIGIKATTTEGLGFVGRREGIAAMATATVNLPAMFPATGAVGQRSPR